MDLEQDLKSTIDKAQSIQVSDLPTFAREVSEEIGKSTDVTSILLRAVLAELQVLEGLEQQTKLLSFLFLLEISYDLSESTEAYLQKLVSIHQFEGNFSTPFQLFIHKRLQIANNEVRRLRIGKPEDAQGVLRLLEESPQFFKDLLELQTYFSQNISPVLPLNATWNPLCTQRFGMRGIKGLEYVYKNNEYVEYRRLMKQQMSSEWTGFNRFSEEPWQSLKKHVRKDGHLLDIGSSIGISALEIANELEIDGAVLLVDYDAALRMADTVRVIDYSDVESKLISLREVQARMDQLRNKRLVVALFGVDFSKQLDSQTSHHVKDSVFTHCANTLIYLQPDKFFQTLLNCLESTKPAAGVLKLHQDSNLQYNPALFSLTIQRQEEKIKLLHHVPNK